MSTETIFRIHLALGYVAWLACFVVYILPWLRSMERFEALWTPTIVLLDPEGVERYRFEGYLPAPDYLARVTLGLGHVSFAMKDWVAAEAWFHEVVEKYGESEVAPEALYWEGVSRYKAGDPPSKFEEAATAIRDELGARIPDVAALMQPYPRSTAK